MTPVTSDVVNAGARRSVSGYTFRHLTQQVLGKCGRAGALGAALALSACNGLPTTELGSGFASAASVSSESTSPESTAFESTAPQRVLSPIPLEMRVRPAQLSLDTDYWLSALKSTQNFQSRTSRYSLERLAGSGRVQDLSRHLNLQLTGVLAALRATGDRALLEKVYVVMERERATLADNDGDGYLDWLYLAANPNDNPGLHGTDKHVMEEIMAHAIVAQAAYAFRLNSNLDGKYSEAASFWEDYLIDHYEAKWQGRTGEKGYPVIEKSLFHPYVNNTRYYHYMFRLTGTDAYRLERDRQVEVIKRHLLPDDGAFVWTHAVNEYLGDRGGKMWWSYQPVGYAGESMSALADLGLEGVLDEPTMRGIANTLSEKLLDGGSRNSFMAGDVGEVRPAIYYSPVLKRPVYIDSISKGRGGTFYFGSRGYALLAPWDETGEVTGRAIAVHNENGVWPITAAGVLLAYHFSP